MTRVTPSPAPARRFKRRRAANEAAVSRNSPYRNNNKRCSGRKRGCTKCARNCERFWDCFPDPNRKRASRSKSGPFPPWRLNPGSSSCKAPGSRLQLDLVVLSRPVEQALGNDTAVVHEALHGLHSAALAAEMVELRIA